MVIEMLPGQVPPLGTRHRAKEWMRRPFGSWPLLREARNEGEDRVVFVTPRCGGTGYEFTRRWCALGEGNHMQHQPLHDTESGQRHAFLRTGQVAIRHAQGIGAMREHLRCGHPSPRRRAFRTEAGNPGRDVGARGGIGKRGHGASIRPRRRHQQGVGERRRTGTNSRARSTRALPTWSISPTLFREHHPNCHAHDHRAPYVDQ